MAQSDAELLRAALLLAARTEDVVSHEECAYEVLYVVDFEMQGKAGSAWVRSVWIVRRGENFPRLVTCYVK